MFNLSITFSSDEKYREKDTKRNKFFSIKNVQKLFFCKVISLKKVIELVGIVGTSCYPWLSDRKKIKEVGAYLKICKGYRYEAK